MKMDSKSCLVIAEKCSQSFIPLKPWIETSFYIMSRSSKWSFITNEKQPDIISCIFSTRYVN